MIFILVIFYFYFLFLFLIVFNVLLISDNWGFKMEAYDASAAGPAILASNGTLTVH
jgi:hypothetical protein